MSGEQGWRGIETAYALGDKYVIPSDKIADVSGRFWAKVRKTESCWLWTAAANKFGRGHFNAMGKGMIASRLAWALHHGKSPGDKLVCHTCDTPACVNPAHLFLGTQKDNIQDCARKGRIYRGSTPPAPKRRLTEAQVFDILREHQQGVPTNITAKRFGISTRLVDFIRAGENYGDFVRKARALGIGHG